MSEQEGTFTLKIEKTPFPIVVDTNRVVEGVEVNQKVLEYTLSHGSIILGGTTEEAGIKNEDYRLVLTRQST